MAFGKMLRTVVIVAVFGVVWCAPVGNDTGAMFYLSQFGYLPSNTRNLQYGALVDESTFNKAITDFQEFAGLNPTGVLDDETLETMKLPRCGVKDKVGNGDRSKRYALQGSRWKVKHLTYKLHKYPHGLDKSKVDAEVKRAFGVWSEYTDLTFEQKHSGQVHIDISFEKGEHGDGDPFDGPGGTLAHAYFPVFGGDAHFDAEERWTIDSYRGTNLFQVAAHEFGHSLGLSHSDVRSALMAPFYRGYEPVFTLDDDDIEGIQALYGEKTSKGSRPSGSSPKPATDKPSASDDAVLCKDPSFDAIFNTADGNTYVFKGDKYWRVDEERVSPGYPKYISKGWPGLPNKIDAAFTYKNGKSYFFKGKQYWRFINRQMEKGYPKDISEGFTGIPDNVDAAMVWSGNGKIYFFKGSKFWRFDPTQRPPVKTTYPKLLSNWEGVPDNLDSAFQYTNGYTYFFKKGAYYRFNDRAFAVERVNPGFPRSTAWWWFGCRNAPKGTIGNLVDKSQGLSSLNDDDLVEEKNKPSDHQFDDVGHFAAAEDGPYDDSGRPVSMDSDTSTDFSTDPRGRDSAAIRSMAAPILLILATLSVIFSTT